MLKIALLLLIHPLFKTIQNLILLSTFDFDL